MNKSQSVVVVCLCVMSIEDVARVAKININSTLVLLIGPPKRTNTLDLTTIVVVISRFLELMLTQLQILLEQIVTD